MMAPTRADQIAAVHAALAPLPTALALWEAGSAAFAADDAYSDVDLMVIAEDGAGPALYEAAEAALQALAPFALRHVMPEPMWHGHSQRFYLLEGASRFHMVDLCVMKRSAADHFLDPTRHGAARVLFDKAGLAVPPAPDPAGRDARIAARLPALSTWFALTQPLVEKEIARGRAIDALAFYHALTLRPLVERLRIAHCPDRHDFALRYLDRDLPPDVHARLLPLAFVTGLDDLAVKHPQAVEWFSALAAPSRSRF